MEDDMKITELLNESGIELGVSVKDKSSAIEILVKLHEKAGNLSDKAEYTQAIKAREQGRYQKVFLKIYMSSL